MWSPQKEASNPWSSDRSYRDSFKPPSSQISAPKPHRSLTTSSSLSSSSFLTLDDIKTEISFETSSSPTTEEDTLLRRNIQVLERKMKLYKDLLRQSEKKKERGKRKVVLTLNDLYDLLRRAKEEGYAQGLKDASSSSSSSSIHKKGSSSSSQSNVDLYDASFSLAVIPDRKTSMLLPRMMKEEEEAL